MPFRVRRSRDESLIEGEPSTLRSGRDRQDEADEAPGLGPELGSAPLDDQPMNTETVKPAPEDASEPAPETSAEASPEDSKDELERLTLQVRSLQEQVEEVVAQRNDAIADQVGRRVATIVQAAEQSAADIASETQQEMVDLRDRARSEAQDEADRIRIEAQADAARIRTDAHADAARLREEALDGIRRQVDRVCAELADELKAYAHQAIDVIGRADAPPAAEEVGAPADEPGLAVVAPPPEPEQPPEPEGPPEPEEPRGAETADPVDELQSAAAVLEQSLRHLQELGQGLS